MLQVKMEGVIVRHIGFPQVKPPLGSLPAASNLGLQGQHGTHRCTPCSSDEFGSLCRLAQVFFQERKDLLPPIDRLLLPIGRTIIIEEAMSSTIIPVELIGFAVLLQLLLMLIHLCRCRRLVVIAKEAQERALQ